MSRPSSPHTGDLDAVLRDDLALEQISRGRRPRGADTTLRLLCALSEDVEIRVPRRRLRGSRFTRGVIATTVAATVLGVTGVAAAHPGDQGGFGLWAPQPNDARISAADRSLTAARTSLMKGRTIEADAALDRADAQLRKAGRSPRADRLRNVATKLRSRADLPSTARPSQTTPQARCLWDSAPDKARRVVVCSGAKTTNPPLPQQTPDPSDSSPDGLPSLLHLPTLTVPPPTTPGRPSPSSPSSPSAQPTSPTSKASGGSGSTSAKPWPRLPVSP